jgi:hypothetical protein
MKTDGNDTLPFFEDATMVFNVPNILTLHGEVHLGQDLFLVQGGNKMKVVEVIGITEADRFVWLIVKDQCTGKVLELSCPLGYDTEYSIRWMVISVPYIVELVIQRLKQGSN